ncbi:immunity protein YezG family protein [Pontibacter virosus]|uniref:Uncharacterized protein DUF600 n=1 Tax=Pontibacter virosus TaxID=1765052 RepID=A0A2U1AQY3_9BACT|nr:immunity protein YezG family protein [Pontibacter virosus]PVY38839.1 uncharacterized protein DUF600 [Pontibacter virosus]
MKNQVKENDLYTSIGQYLIDSLDYNIIEDWDKAVFTVKAAEDGFIRTNLDFENNSVKINIAPISVSKSKVNIYDVIDDLKEYTVENNYTPWNTFVFKLTSSHQFDIEYSWDQYFQDNRE